jgi:menaquinone-dependent protoporphyrinogen IX oxidase
MLRTSVVYRSVSGFTKKYAAWIAEDLNADIYEAKEANWENLANYDLIIFGGSMHAVGINGVKIIKENLSRLADKKVVIFAVGASPPRENILDEIRAKNFSSEEQKKVELFYLRGGFNYGKLNLSNKVLMTLFRVKLSMKKNKTPDEKGMLAAYSKPIDCARKENIKGIVEYVKSLAQ